MISASVSSGFGMSESHHSAVEIYIWSFLSLIIAYEIPAMQKTIALVGSYCFVSLKRLHVVEVGRKRFRKLHHCF